LFQAFLHFFRDNILQKKWERATSNPSVSKSIQALSQQEYRLRQSNEQPSHLGHNAWLICLELYFAIKAVQTTSVNKKTTLSVMWSTQSKSILKPTATLTALSSIVLTRSDGQANNQSQLAVMWKRQETMPADVCRLTSPNEFIRSFVYRA